MSTKISCYFNHFERFPFPDFIEGISETYELLAKVKPFLEALLTDKDVREDHSEHRGGEPVLHGNYFIGEGTVLYNGVTIIGPVYIGKNCELMPGALIRPNTIVSDGCSVGHGSEVKRTVMFGGSKVASLSFVGDSILGASARVGSGVITANRRFDQQNARLKYSGEVADLGDSFFGCVLGDSARLGANSVPSPGTHIGQYSWILPLTSVRGFIPPDVRVYNKAEVTMQKSERQELKP
jgi:bifunctional UDP-N-acetylglucosamine pyrophosphorylase/glucosamine-1-phosphate N-acetyltransferase